MLIVNQAAVTAILSGREAEVIDLVRDAYRLHDEGRTSVPHSIFLRFPDNARNRIIGLPAYLDGEGGTDPVAGMKWISSFPANIDAGIQRASAAILLNSLATGHPEALIEGSVISAKRTAASAALAAALLTEDDRPSGVTLIGCGVINQEVLRFLAVAVPGLTEITVYDHDSGRAGTFAIKAAELVPGAKVTVAAEAKDALASHRLVSIATTAAEPHMDLSALPAESVVLHVSLRDLDVASIVDSVNVVDDTDHAVRERTSLHLAEQQTGGRAFVHATIGALIRGTAALPPRDGRHIVFSPFGLGCLDLALARDVRTEAAGRGLGVRVDDFLTAAI
ncbi:2,3-diaminopropionate biosynthesis protein SbnB [Longispora albida]|uniref:2,3-diaminopropionate biosynthesis protein SbnB n=1 Tax=Longispora albida TaxID=203523 RepID=UPI00036DFE0E|nr:2,3-diaminopropionate biosynthesis protein SbnB [Longispora albida]